MVTVAPLSTKVAAVRCVVVPTLETTRQRPARLVLPVTARGTSAGVPPPQPVSERVVAETRTNGINALEKARIFMESPCLLLLLKADWNNQVLRLYAS